MFPHNPQLQLSDLNIQNMKTRLLTAAAPKASSYLPSAAASEAARR